METIKGFLLAYGNLMYSWWWISLAIIVFITFFAYTLIDADARVSVTRAVWLTILGVLSLFPVLRNAIPINIYFEFRSRWISAVDKSFSWFPVIVLIILSILFAPLLFIWFGYSIAMDQYKNSCARGKSTQNT